MSKSTAKGRELMSFRLVCQSGGEKITLRQKAKDKYEAFEEIVSFLRRGGFDYQVVSVEPS
jgi:hypothetical protein